MIASIGDSSGSKCIPSSAPMTISSPISLARWIALKRAGHDVGPSWQATTLHDPPLVSIPSTITVNKEIAKAPHVGPARKAPRGDVPLLDSIPSAVTVESEIATARNDAVIDVSSDDEGATVSLNSASRMSAGSWKSYPETPVIVRRVPIPDSDYDKVWFHNTTTTGLQKVRKEFNEVKHATQSGGYTMQITGSPRITAGNAIT